MATQRTVRTAGRSTTMGMIGLAALLTAALIGSLFIALRTPAPALPLAPATPAVPPAIDPAQQGVMGYIQAHSSAAPDVSQSNRQFADEVAGAGAQYMDAASLTDPLPERLQDLVRPSAPAVVEPLVQPIRSGRFFADEIAAGAGVAYETALELPSVFPQNGPR